jgi:hypothetical protein
MTGPTARAVHGRVRIDLPDMWLDDLFCRLAADLRQSHAVQSALCELANAQAWLECPPHAGEPGVLDPQTYRIRRDNALATLRAVVEPAVLSLAAGSAGDLGRDLEHAAAHILATSTQDVLRTLGGHDD